MNPTFRAFAYELASILEKTSMVHLPDGSGCATGTVKGKNKEKDSNMMQPGGNSESSLGGAPGVINNMKMGMAPVVPPKSWRAAAGEGLHHEGPGAGGMLLGTIVGGRYGRPLEGAALGYGAGAGLGLLADKGLSALKKAKK